MMGTMNTKFCSVMVLVLALLIAGCTPPVAPDRPSGPPVPSSK